MGYTEAVANQPADQFEQVIYDAETDQFTGPKPEGLPTMVGYQAAGAAPFLRGAPLKTLKLLQQLSALVIQSWNHAKAVVRDSQGWFDELTDAEILEAQRLLSMYEGVFGRTRFCSVDWRCNP